VYVSRGKVFYKCDECCDMYFECKHCLNIHKMQLHSNDKRSVCLLIFFGKVLHKKICFLFSDFKMCDTCSQMYADKCELFSTYGEFREQFNRLVYLKIDNFHLMCDCVLFVIIFIIAYIFYLSKIFSYHLL